MVAVEEAFTAVEADSTVGAGAFVAGLAAVADSAAGAAIVAGLGAADSTAGSAVEVTMVGLAAIIAGAGAVMADSATAAGGETVSSSALVTPGTTGPGLTMAMMNIPITRTTAAILTVLIPAAAMATVRI